MEACERGRAPALSYRDSGLLMTDSKPEEQRGRGDTLAPRGEGQNSQAGRRGRGTHWVIVVADTLKEDFLGPRGDCTG
jgi:hypothetical protein